jgi:hypothetical protein
MLKTLLNVLDLSGYECRACRKPIVATDAFGASEGVCAACSGASAADGGFAGFGSSASASREAGSRSSC